MRVSTRTVVVALVASFAAACAPQVSSRSGAGPDAARNDPVRAVMLVQKPQHVKLALRTGAEMLGGKGLPARAITVVACGEEVASLRAGGDLEPDLAAARSAGVRVAACGISLERAGLDARALSASIEVVPNGLVEVLRLQHDGYLSVEP